MAKVDKQALIDRIRSNFPSELIALDQWVVWRMETRDDKPTKVPYAASTSHKAESDNPATWSTFETAVKAYQAGNYSGLGFMFSEHDPYVGVDFDKCVADGVIAETRADYVKALDSYSEYSQSKTGVHTIVQGKLPPSGRKSTKYNIELYEVGRFFVVTGDHIPSTPRLVNDRQKQLAELHQTLWPPAKNNPKKEKQPSQPASLSDQELIERMFASANGAAIQALWNGSASAHNGDESAADLALVNHLAFWTNGEHQRIDQLFRGSGLYRPKWDKQHRGDGATYGQMTIEKVLADFRDGYTGKVHVNGHSQTTATVKPEYLLSQGVYDEGNAQCVHLRHNGRFLHSDALGWLHHTGTHWSLEGAEAKLDRAIVDTLNARIEAALHSGKADQYGDLIKKAIPTSGRVQGAKYLLGSLVDVSPDSFDTDFDLLNCRNGVLNLRTGELIAHAPAQRFMHCTKVSYNPKVDTTPWVNWLSTAVDNQEIADWLQMAVGYSLTGHTREEVLFYLYGPPRSGKGTFTETLLALLGAPLAKEVNFATFTAQRTGDSQNFDLAPLKPCRFVMASESNTYERFNEAKVKALTGGNEVYCAFKHHTHFSYKPLYKIWLSSNQPVNADPDDDAVWGRLRVIEFPHSHLGSEDKTLKQQMRSPAIMEGVLAWAVQGARKWYQLGSRGLPELVSSFKLKQEHRDALDNVGMWIEERCLVGSGGFTSNSLLYLSYEKWCRENGVEPKKQKSFSQALIRKNYQSKLTKLEGKMMRGFVGIAVA